MGPGSIVSSQYDTIIGIFKIDHNRRRILKKTFKVPNESG